MMTKKLKTKILSAQEGDAIDVKTLNEDIYEEWYIVKRIKRKTEYIITIAVTRYKWDKMEEKWYEIFGYLFDFHFPTEEKT